MVLVTVCDFARWLGCLSIWGYFRSHFNGFKFTSSSFKQHNLLYHLETDYSLTKSFNGWHVKHLPPLRKIRSWCNTDSLTRRHRKTTPPIYLWLSRNSILLSNNFEPVIVLLSVFSKYQNFNWVTGGPSSRLERKQTINSWKDHVLCDSVLSFERNRWEFEHAVRISMGNEIWSIYNDKYFEIWTSYREKTLSKEKIDLVPKSLPRPCLVWLSRA